MRVVSMVPSWTETLLAAGVDVVGCTRFCIHPRGTTSSIPKVGGTKDWDWDKIVALRPELILLDREENPRFMSEQNSIPWHATHVESIEQMPKTLRDLERLLSKPQLAEFADRWDRILEKPTPKTPSTISTLPGIIRWGKKPSTKIETVLYLIWKNPWMTVSQNTFIGSVWKKLGLELPLWNTKYPEVQLEDYNPKSTLLLFSSEPYPFLRQKEELAKMDFPHAFVDGEAFSWFGVRTLEFLEQIFNQQ